MLNLFLVRHGQTKWNVEKRLQGFLDSDLTELGVFQAEKLGERLSEVEFSKIYVSPRGRTLKTAKLVAGNKENELLTDDRLQEMNFGSLEGREFETIEHKYKVELDNMHVDPVIYNPVSYGGETFDSLLSRSEDFLNDITKKDKGNVLVVAHGMSLMAIIAVINKIKLEDYWNKGLKPNVSLTLYEYNGDSFDEKLFYDTTHYE